MKVTKITARDYIKYIVVYPSGRVVRYSSKTPRLPSTVVDVLLNGTCENTRYQDEWKIEIFAL